MQIWDCFAHVCRPRTYRIAVETHAKKPRSCERIGFGNASPEGDFWFEYRRREPASFENNPSLYLRIGDTYTNLQLRERRHHATTTMSRSTDKEYTQRGLLCSRYKRTLRREWDEGGKDLHSDFRHVTPAKIRSTSRVIFSMKQPPLTEN